jgi:hypothetical protein
MLRTLQCISVAHREEKKKKGEMAAVRGAKGEEGWWLGFQEAER